MRKNGKCKGQCVRSDGPENGQYRLVLIRRDTGEKILTDCRLSLSEFQAVESLLHVAVLAPGHRLNPRR